MTHALNYICANSIETLVLAKGSSGAVLNEADTILSEIERRCGADVAALFARPTFRSSPDSTVVSWYAVGSGSPRPLAEFDDVGQRPFADALRARLSRLVPIMADPNVGADVGATLNIRSFGDIYVVGRDPVLVNWGLLPREAATSDATREQHFRQTLGAFLDEIPTPPLDFREARAFTEAIASRKQASESRNRAQSVASQQAAGSVDSQLLGKTAPSASRTLRPWFAPLVACVLAGLVLIGLSIPGVLTRAQIISPDQSLIDRQRLALQEVNKSIQQQIADLKRKSAELVCRALPGSTNTTVVSPNLLPPPPQDVPVQPPTPGGPTNAAQLADQAVALVRATLRNGGASGSAFFINDHLLVTNDHVVDDGGADATTVTIENKTLGRRVPAKIIARTHREHQSDPDFALLEVPAKTSRAFLKVASQPAKTAPVRSIGFPGLILGVNDAAIPESSMTDGNVSTFIQVNGQKLIVHTAAIFPGNSGGPLVDLCSRVVGVNTEYLAERNVPGAFYMAQATAPLLAFLSANGQNLTVDSTACPAAGIAFGGPAAASPPR